MAPRREFAILAARWRRLRRVSLNVRLVALAGGFACKLLLGASDWNFLLCPHLLFVCRCFVCFYILRFYDLCVCVQLFVQS